MKNNNGLFPLAVARGFFALEKKLISKCYNKNIKELIRINDKVQEGGVYYGLNK